jgi:ribonucleoside-diphosphate reductase alpha chain
MNWIKGTDYPIWMEDEGLKTLQRQHLLEQESPAKMYERIVNTLEKRYLQMLINTNKFTLDECKEKATTARNKWYDYIWKGWLCPSTPICANIGTKRGYNISCFTVRLDDTLDSIYQKVHEMSMLSKMGGGVGVTFDKVRGRGEPISTGGFSEGTIPFMKVYDSAITAASQSNIRRGAASINLPIRHKDIKEFLHIREPKGDLNKQCLNINHCVTIDDYFMEQLEEGDTSYREIYAELLSARLNTGEPYIMYYHNVHNSRPVDMAKRNLKINGTNICTEILLPHDPKHSFVCCISSTNLIHWDAIKKDKEYFEYAYLFLDVNLEEFIANARGKRGFENAIRFAEKSRAIGLGVLGFHSLLQSKMAPFVSLQARGIISEIGKKMREDGNAYNKKYGEILGNPEWCDENRNLTLQAIAPTTTNSLISGGVSQGIEPIVANSFIQKSAKGTFIRKSKYFEKLIKEKYPEKDTFEFWKEIEEVYKGSVQHLDFLTEEEKEVFLTAYEINQLELIRNASIWQQYIDQGISLNLFFPADVSPKWFSKCHIEAWKMGIKTLYYVRTESILSRNMSNNTFSDCTLCAD